MQLIVQDVGWATKGVEVPHNRIALELGELLDWNLACILDGSVVVNLIDIKHGVGPEIGLDGVGPSLLGMDKASAGGLCQVSDSLLSDSVLVVSIGAAEGNRLPPLAEMIHPSFLCEVAILGMIVLDGDPTSPCI